MTAIFTGLGAGFARSSATVLGGQGLLGSGSTGRAGDDLMVNAASGNLVINRQDEFLSGRGLDLGVSRTYNSLGQTSDRDNNDNWQMSTTRRVLNLTGTLNTAGSTVQRLDSDGSVVTYAYGTRGGVTAYWSTDGDGAYDKLVSSGSNWIWTDGTSQVTETYVTATESGAWRISLEKDPDLNTITFNYLAGTDHIDTVTVANNVAGTDPEYIKYIWSGNNVTRIDTGFKNLVTGELFVQSKVYYGYDAQNRLTTVTTDLSPEAAGTGDGDVYTINYAYGTNGLISQVTQSDGSRTDIAYDTEGRVSSLTEYATATETRVTSFSYGASYTNVTAPNGQITRLDYAGDDLTANAQYDWSVAAATKQASGSLLGDPATLLTANGGVQAYSAAGFSANAGDTVTFSVSLQAMAGSATTQNLGIWATSGWVDASTARIVSGPGQLSQVSGSYWQVTGLSTTQATRIEITRTFSATQSGSAVAYLDLPGGYRAGQQLLVAGGFVSKTSPTEALRRQLAKITAPPAYSGATAQVQTFAYDSDGNLTSSTAPDGTVTSYTYDAMGNITHSQRRTSGGLQVGSDEDRWYNATNDVTEDLVYGSNEDYASVSHYTRNVYDSEGHLVYRISPDGRVTEYRYSATGLLQWEVEYKVDTYSVSSYVPTQAEMDTWRDGQADKSQRTLTYYNYDARGNMTQALAYASTDSTGTATTTDGYTRTWYTYDQAGRLISRSADGIYPETFVYDGLGRLVASNDTSGAVTSVYFDDANTRTVMQMASGLTRTLTYNKSGDLISQIDSSVGQTSANQAPDLAANWTSQNLTRTTATAINGQTAYQYTASASGTSAQLYAFSSVAAGETVRYRITLQGDGVTTMDKFGLYGSSSGWGANTGDARAIIVSGAGRLTQVTGGLWQIDAMSSTTPTVIEIVRTFDVAQTAGAYFYVGGTGSEVTAGESVILSAPSLTKTTTNSAFAISTETDNQYDKLGRLRVSYDTFDNGNHTYFVYDNAGRKTAELNEYGEMTEYFYDADNRVVETAHYFNRSTSYLTALQDPNNTVTVAQLRPVANAQDVRAWTVYDANGNVVQTISGTGDVTSMAYDGMGRLVQTTSYATQVSTSAYNTTPPTSPVTVTVDANNDRVVRTFYDRNGNVRGMLDGEGYLTEYDYDKANRKVEEIAYATVTPAGNRASSSFTTIRGLVAGNSADRHTHYVYDNAGRLRFTLDALNHVTRFDYNSWGKLTTTTRYYNTVSVSTYDMATVTAAVVADGTNDRATLNGYSSLGQLAWTRDEIGTYTYYYYNYAGNLIRSQVGSDSNKRITRNWYDARNQLRFSVDPEGFLTSYTYTTGGRLSAKATFDNAVTVTDTTTIDQVAALATGAYVQQRYSYDNVGRVSKSYDGTNDLTQYAYDGTGALDQVNAGDTDSSTVDESITAYDHDADGNRTKEYDGSGQPESATITTAYNAFGETSIATDAKNLSTTLTYDRRGLLVQSLDGAGGKTTYVYNAFGEVVQVTDPNNNAKSSGQKSSYTYYDLLGRATMVRDAEDYITETSYTTFGDVASVTRRYNRTTSAVSVTTPPTVTADPANDATTSFLYNRLGEVTQATDAQGFYETYAYSVYGTRTSVTNKLGATTTYVYDRRGLKTSETLPMSSVDATGTTLASTVTNTFAYDSRGNLKTQTRAVGLPEVNVTQYNYDAANRLIETVGQTFTGLTPHTHYYYDARGNLSSTVEPDNARTVHFYDDLGRVSAEINAIGSYTAYTYDANGNVTDIKVYATPVTVPADGGSQEEAPAAPTGSYRETTFTYDNVNRMLTSTVVGVTTGTYNGTTWTAATGNLTTTYQYDANGNVVKTLDPNNNATWVYYDNLNRKLTQIDGANYRTDWTYDDEGNVTQERRYLNTSTPTSVTVIPTVTADANLDRITDYTYDKVGNRLTETREKVLVHDGAGGQTSVNQTVSYLYNGLGQVTRKTQATGEQFNYTYDTAGRLTQETRPAFTDYTGATGITPLVLYYYDGLGNLTRTKQSGNTTAADRITTYGYDGGKLRWIADAEFNDGVSSDGKRTWYDYDIAGNVQREYYNRLNSGGTNAGGNDYEGTFRAYDGLGHVTQQWLTTHTSAGGWVQNGPTTTSTYNAYGDVATVQVGTGSTQQNQYDAAGRLIGSNAGDGVWKYFAYDRNGNQTGEVDSAGADLTSQTFATAKVMANVAVTYTLYNSRNLATDVYEAGRDLSTTVINQTLHTLRSYNSFGEVATETDASGAAITYTYNNMGKVIRSESPTVSITLEDSTSLYVKPSEDYYYDGAGRLVATRDDNGTYASGGTSTNGTSKAANTGNLTKLTLLAGSGYDGNQALTTTETHPDGGVKTTKYDIFGDARVIVDEMNRTIASQTFDQMDRLSTLTGASGLVDNYSYDALGHQLTHWNSLYGSGNAETTDYDVQGRVTSQRAFGGDTTTNSYVWDSTIGGFGGWTQTTTMANSKVSTVKTDIFDRQRYKSDLGGHVFNFAYDNAGRMTSITEASAVQTYTWYNTDKVKSIALTGAGAGTEPSTTYGYDAVGNLVSQSTSDNAYGTTQSLTATYDKLGRMTSWTEAGNATSPYSTMSYSYDANGNVRRVQGSYRILDSQGTASPSNSAYDAWYTYDSMNRVVISQGLYGSQYGEAAHIYAGTQGKQVYYNLAGQRTQAWSSRLESGSGTFYNPYDGQYYSVNYSYDAPVREDYTYDSAGRLYQVQSAEGSFDANSWWMAGVAGYNYPNDYFVSPPSGPGGVVAQYSYDTMGRVTLQQDLASGVVQYSDALTYDSAGRVTTDDNSTKRTGTSDIYRNVTTNTYLTGTSSNLGSPNSSATTTYLNGSDSAVPNTSSTNTYVWWDSAMQGTIGFNDGAGHNYTTTYNYNSYGQLTSVGIADGRPRTITFHNAADGQIIRRDEADNNGSAGDPHEVFYRFGGKQVGDVGNNGTDNQSYVATTQERDAAPGTGAFRTGAASGSTYADFGLDYGAINSYDQGSQASTYAVQSGDTLQSIAAALWGDADLWYKLADANGLTSTSTLVEGRNLTIPTGVERSQNNASTFKPYDPADTIGNTSPTTPKPKKGNNCGVFGQILLAVIAIAVTAIALPAGGFAAASIGQGALAGLAGGVASQLAGIATGIQQKFDFKGVALAALSGAVGAGLGNLTKISQGLKGVSNFLNIGVAGNVASGALASGITQGVGVATGLQDKFSWAGVAAAGVAAGIGGQLGKNLTALDAQGGLSFGNIASQVGVGAVRILASAATRSAIEGSSFGNNIEAGLPDVLGQIVVQAMGGALGLSQSGSGGTRAGGVGDETGPAAPSIPVGPITAMSSSTAFDPLTPQQIQAAFNQMQSQLGSPVSNENAAFGNNLATQGEEVRTAIIRAEAARRGGPDGYSTSHGTDPYFTDVGRASFTDAGWAVTSSEMTRRQADFDTWKQSLDLSDSKLLHDVNLREESLKVNQKYVDELNAYADRQINELLFVGAAPMLIAAGAVAAPAVAGYAGSLYVAGSTASTVASSSAGFFAGGSFGVGFEFAKNRAFGLADTWGGYTAAFVGGGLGGTGLRLVPRSFLLDPLGRAANRGLVGGLAGFTGESSNQLITTGGDFRQIDSEQLLLQSGIGGVAGAAFPEFRWNGMTIGRNNPGAVYASLQTRVNSGDISQFQLRYPANAGVANAVEGLWGQGAGAFADGAIKKAVGH